MLLVCPLLALSIVRLNAQSEQKTTAPDELFRTIAAQDAALFDSYNKCDLAKFDTFFVDDVEFYHDKGGLTVGRQNLTESIKKNICGKVTRELVPGTLEVYPINGYGAVEIGVHRFLHPSAQDHGEVGEAKFIHLWQNKNGVWKITRVISFDHHTAAK
jgi:hypothetical protein